MASAKDIIITAPVPLAPVPPPSITLPSDAPDEEVNAIFREVRHLLESCGTNLHDHADVAISALIDRGIDTGPRLIGAAKRLGFKTSHAGIILSEGIGHRWSRDKDGTYRNLM